METPKIRSASVAYVKVFLTVLLGWNLKRNINSPIMIPILKIIGISTNGAFNTNNATNNMMVPIDAKIIFELFFFLLVANKEFAALILMIVEGSSTTLPSEYKVIKKSQ